MLRGGGGASVDLSVHEHGQCQVFRKGHDKCFAKVIKYLKHVYQRAFARGAEEGGKAFTETIKYLRHILEGFCTGWQRRAG